VKVRRAFGTPKYQQVRGGNTKGLYGADHLADHSAALFCEGEFDALLAAQEAGTLASVVTLSSATATLNVRWYAELAHSHPILVAYDRDTAGTRGANRLLSLSPRFHTIQIPHGKDISDFFLHGGDIYGWLDTCLALLTELTKEGNGKNAIQK
jgi:DNA primase